jgi:ActR/RegA family two-component response regulator
MKGRHLGLIVEDDSATAEDLTEILKSLDCDSVVADNKHNALTSLRQNSFCFVLLDLEIKGEADSIKGHTAHGHALLREIRKAHADHRGSSYWMPILIVSGFAREVGTAVDAMKDGASDVIQKPFNSRSVSDAVHRALETSGRVTHDLCGGKPNPPSSDPSKGVVLAIPGDRVGRRTGVVVDGRVIRLPDRSLRVLLHLMVAHVKGTEVHKRTLGAKADQGFKGISELREWLKPALGDGIDIIGNDQHGNYSLTDGVTINSCDSEKLAKLGDATITKLARELARALDARRAESEGKP